METILIVIIVIAFIGEIANGVLALITLDYKYLYAMYVNAATVCLFGEMFVW